MDAHAVDQPSGWVLRFAPLVPAGSTVLDLACGAGRHSRLFAARGCRVTAVDRAPQLDAGLLDDAAIELVVADLEGGTWPLAGRRFDAVVVTNYLHRPLFGRLVAALAPGGLLLYETFAQGNAEFGKPGNPDFLLAPGELLRLLGGSVRVIAFEDGFVDRPRRAMVQRLAARALAPTGEFAPGLVALQPS